EALLKSKAVIPGNSAKSPLIERVTSQDEAKRMPLKAPPLAEKEIALLRAWIDQGVSWQEGFSFGKPRYVATLQPRRPELPPARDGRTNPIDRILDAYMQQHKVTPAPLDDAAFLRRVSLDLIGLLPTTEQLDAFLADATADKRDRLIRRLLDDQQGY